LYDKSQEDVSMWNRHKKVLAFCVITTLILIGATVGIGRDLADNAEVSHTDWSSFAARVPERLDRYEVLLVTTPADVPCSSFPVIYLRGPDPTVEAFLAGPGTDKAQEELRKLGITERVELSVGGPGTSKEELLTTLAQWVEMTRERGCFKSGPIPD
jgi:hypothetical protein